MKLVRFGAPGAEKPGLVDAQGAVRDLSAHVKDITGDTLSPASLDKLRKHRPQVAARGAAGRAARRRRSAACATSSPSASTMPTTPRRPARRSPSEPILFNKLPNCIVGPNDDVMVPKASTKLDYEIEIAFVIGTRARYVAREERAVPHRRLLHLQRHLRAQLPGRARRAVDEGQVRRDVRAAGTVARHARRDRGRAEPAMSLDVNGERRQTGNTETMIFGIAHCLHYISQFMVLEPGDVVTTGTPPGVALGMKPPVWLKPGDVMTLKIEGLGEQKQKVVPFKE